MSTTQEARAEALAEALYQASESRRWRMFTLL